LKEQQGDSAKEAQRKAKLKAEELEQAAKDLARRKAYLAREQEIEKGQKARNAPGDEKQASAEMENSRREKLRKEAYLAQESKRAQEQAARRLNEKK
jgi:hypothetical protein